MRMLPLVGSLAALLGASAAGAQTGRLLVAQKGDRSLAIVDPVAGTVIANIQENGTTGHEVAGSADGRLAFVPIYGNSGVGKPGTDGKNIVVIDVAAQKVVGNIEFDHGVRPHCAVIGPKDGMLYVTTELDQAVTIIDPKTLKIVGAIPTGQPESHMLALSHDGLRGYTANVGPGTVSVLDVKARKTLKIIPVSGNVQRIAISNDDRWVFTADQTAPRMAVIDTATDKVAKLGEDRRAGLRRSAHSGRALAACGVTGREQSRRDRPEDDDAGTRRGRGQGAAGGAGAARWKSGIRFMRWKQ